MIIHGLTVSVNYADYLRNGLPTWAQTLDKLICATAPGDVETISACSGRGIHTHITDAFYRRGALFNKGAAIAEAAAACNLLAGADAVILFDADIIPPADWRARLGEIAGDCIYGARREDENGNGVGDSGPCGWLLLFDARQPQARRDPIVDVNWTHAGNYDTTFVKQWPVDKLRWLPFNVAHRGPVGVNWCGRGNAEAMTALHKERQRRGGWAHERI